MKDNKVVYEIKLEKSVKVILGAFAFGLFLNAVPVANAQWGYEGDRGALRNAVIALNNIASAINNK